MSDNDNFYKDQFNQLSTKVNELVSNKAQNNFSLNYNINSFQDLVHKEKVYPLRKDVQKLLF